ncbi:MAG TPA: hypothetical protein VM388_04850 [Acidimicrobiales bacterium]|nr:hypothetical protein [Acidimicrobiales bacterium]
MVVAAVTFAGVPGLWRGLAVAVALAFTALSSTHVVVFFFRSRSLWRRLLAEHAVEDAAGGHAPAPAVPAKHVSPANRRAFLLVTGSALAAIVAGPLAVSTRRPAEAQTGDCLVRCLEQQYRILSSCLTECQSSLGGCLQTQDSRMCLSQYQTCTVRCTQRTPIGSAREHCEAACDRGTTTTSSTTSSSSTTTTTIDCGPFGCGG